MFKSIANSVFSFDIEWIPDPLSAELLHGVEHNPPFSFEESFLSLWKDGGATAERPQPFIKTILCRIVSIAGIFRERTEDGVQLKLVSLPADPTDPKWTERYIIERFLEGVGRRKPQLVGYNSHNADVPIIVQRAIVHGLDSCGFAERPDKPWDGCDYFSTASDYNIDLAPILGRYAATPRLHEIATLSGIPGKIDVSGETVPQLWLEGKLQEIVNYNEFDAFTTHLVWARVAHFGGLLSTKAFLHEEQLVRELLLSEIASGKEHLGKYIEAWDRLKSIIAERRGSQLPAL